MIYWCDNNKKIHKVTGVSVTDGEGNARNITKFFITLSLVWQAVHSCFGAGYWRNDLPWSNTDLWRNN